MSAYRQERMDNMKKITNKKYEAIIQAKNIISQLCEDGAMDYVESGVDVVRNTCLMKAPALLKEALLTVLTSGTLSDNGFQMPATACCCENFSVTRKQMKRHSLSLLVCDPLDKRADEDGYFTMPVFGRVFIINFKPGNPIPLGAERKGSFFTKKIKNLLFFLLSPEKSSILNMTEQKSKKSAERRRANGSKRAKCNDINKGKVVS